MAETPEYFDNVTIGQFVLTGIPIKVYVNGGYLTITDPDDIEDAEIGFGMDTDGVMHSFDYRTVDHLLVGDQTINLATYKKALEDEKPGAEKPAEEEGEEEKGKEKKGEEKANPFEGKQNMKLKSLIEKSVSQDQQKLFGTALSVKRGDTPKSDVSKTISKLAAALPEKELEKFAGTKHKDLPKKKVEEDLSVSDISEPYTIQVGDMIQNVNPNCMHYGSMGIVQKIMDLPNDMGQVVKYSVTNNGDTYKAGDTLTKTMDQLSAIEDEDWNDEMEDWDVVDIDMMDDDDFHLGKTDPNWNDEDWDDDDELTEASRDEQKAAIEAAKAKMEQGKAMMDAAKEDMKVAKDMKVEK
jgi:hypothetical protein